MGDTTQAPQSGQLRYTRVGGEPTAKADPFAPPPELLRWLYKGQSRVLPDGIRRPRRLSNKPRSASSTSLLSLFNAQGGLCCYCASEMTLPPKLKGSRKKWPTDAEVTEVAELHPPTEVTRDHLHPKSDGGPGLLENFAAACRLCNQEKGDLPLIMFLLARTTNTLREAHRRQKHIKAALQELKKP